MIILILFAFFSGIVTILSPCILPVLPLVLSGSLTGGKHRPLGIVTGFVISFTFFTLFLSAIVKATNLSSDALRTAAVVILILFGLSLLLPKFQKWMEQAFNKLSALSQATSLKPQATSGFWSGIPIGMSLGLVWAPCVGPIIASVITLAATSTVNGAAILITLAYSLGTALPMLAITYGGRQLLAKIPWLLSNTAKIQKGFGIVMIAIAVAIFLNLDRTFQTFVLTTFPNYGTGLTQIEDNSLVHTALQAFTKKPAPATDTGKPMNQVQNGNASMLPRLGKAPGFQKAAGSDTTSGGWINTPPLTVEGLKGKVVLVDFWTYTCINCIRTLPYVKSWYEKYKDKGLVIIGAHTPEFEFEKDTNNVKKAVKDFGITYPVVQDNNYGIWQDYNNQYWPADYLVDKNGYIRETHFGEGDYDQTEKTIQELLSENGSVVDDKINNPPSVIQANSPETYLGASRMQYSVSPETVTPNTQQSFTAPPSIPANSFAYQGNWTIGDERAMPKKGAQLQLHFNAGQAFLVMRPKDGTKGGTIHLLLDGKELDASNAGDDVKQGTVTITDDRLYRLIKLSQPGDHILTIQFQDDNVEAFAFTFG